MQKAERAGHLLQFERALLPHHVFEQRDLAVVDEEPQLPRLLEIRLTGEQTQCLKAIVLIAGHGSRRRSAARVPPMQ